MSKKMSPKDKSDPNYATRDIVLGKIRGYPPWPGMIVDPDSVPEAIAKERPGKKSDFYCVKFFPVGDYAWLVAKDISALAKDEIDTFLKEPKRKTPNLLEGYRIALDPKDWEAEQAKAHQRRKEAEDSAEVDQLDGEEEADDDDEKPAKAGRKRKRDAEAGGKSKSKKRGSDADKDTGESKKKKRKTSKKNGLSAEIVESEDEGNMSANKSTSANKRGKKDKDDDDERFEHLKNDPEAVKMRTVRHQLQKAFLGKTGPIESDMEEADSLFKDVEQKDISIDYLSFSKIGKVMRHIASLEPEKIPRDSEFNFRNRASSLVTKWQQILGSKATSAGVTAVVNGSSTEAAAKKEDGEADGEGEKE